MRPAAVSRACLMTPWCRVMCMGSCICLKFPHSPAARLHWGLCRDHRGVGALQVSSDLVEEQVQLQCLAKLQFDDSNAMHLHLLQSLHCAWTGETRPRARWGPHGALSLLAAQRLDLGALAFLLGHMSLYMTVPGRSLHGHLSSAMWRSAVGGLPQLHKKQPATLSQ